MAELDLDRLDALYADLIRNPTRWIMYEKVPPARSGSITEQLARPCGAAAFGVAVINAWPQIRAALSRPQAEGEGG